MDKNYKTLLETIVDRQDYSMEILEMTEDTMPFTLILKDVAEKCINEAVTANDLESNIQDEKELVALRRALQANIIKNTLASIQCCFAILTECKVKDEELAKLIDEELSNSFKIINTIIDKNLKATRLGDLNTDIVQ